MSPFEGSFRKQYLNWVSFLTTERSVLVAIDGRVSVADLLEYLRAEAPELRLDEIGLDGSVRWYRPANAAELVERAEWNARKDRSHADYERRVWANLVEKYGPAGPPPAEVSL